MIILEDFTAELESWDNFKTYLESLPVNQVGGVTADAILHPIAIYLRLKYQNKTVSIDPVLSGVDDWEVLTPIWIRKYLEFFLPKQERQMYTVDTCLHLLNRVIEELSPPVEQPPESIPEINSDGM